MRHRSRKSSPSAISGKAEAGVISPLAGEKVFSCACEGTPSKCLEKTREGVPRDTSKYPLSFDC